MDERVEPTTIGIADLLKIYNFPDFKAKLVRHSDPKRCDIDDLIRRGWFDFYQSTQKRPVFDNCDRIVSFIGTDETKSRFIGVYKVLTKMKGNEVPPPKGWPQEFCNYEYYYELKKEPGYEQLENRVIIDWGDGTRSWVQKMRNKEVIEILPSDQTLLSFSDYLDFTLTHTELKELFNNPDANRDWRSRLSAVAGIYLILATTTGHQYIGSAYGTDGIWGRWKTYAHNGHGGNKILKALIQKDSAYPTAFSYSILQILPKSYTQKDVIKHEHRYMCKLGSRSTGLNS